MMGKAIIGLIVMGCLVSGCASTKVYILGLDVNQAITDMKSKDAKQIIIGMVASVGTHVAGHYIAGQLVGGDIEQQGVCEVTLNGDELNTSDKRWISRGGFVAQVLVNTILASSKATRHTSFTRGFTLASMLEIGGYPVRYRNKEKGDLYSLDKRGGNAALEWGIYMGVSLYDFYLINNN